MVQKQSRSKFLETLARQKRETRQLLKKFKGPRRTRGGGGGGGGSPTPQDSNASAEAEKKRLAERAKKKALAQQRALAKRRSDALKAQRELAKKLRSMSKAKQRQFLIDQRNISKAVALEKLKEEGKKLTPQAEKLLGDVKAQVKKAEVQKYFREAVSKVAESKQSVKKEEPKSQKLGITKKLESFLFKTGIINKKKYQDFEKKALAQASRFEKSKFGKEVKDIWGDLEVASNQLFYELPIALANLTYKGAKEFYKGAKQPNKTFNVTVKQLSNLNRAIQRKVKQSSRGGRDFKKDLKLIYGAYLKRNVANKALRRKLLNSFSKLVRNPKSFITNFSRGAVRTAKKTFRKETVRKADRFVRGVSKTFIKTTYSNVKELPAGLVALANNPLLVKEIPKGIITRGKANIKLLRTSPSQGIGRIAGDLYTYKIVGDSLKFTGKVSSKLNAKLNPLYKRFKGDVLNYNVPAESFVRRGKEVYLKKRVSKPTVKRPISIVDKLKGRKPGQFKKFQKKKGIKLRKGLLTRVSRPLSEQLKFAGKKGTITTAQADRLVSFLRREKVIRKPIPGEENLSPRAQALLKKFDKGKINKKEFNKLNDLVLKQTGKTLLERSLFADPTGLIRFTRLGGKIGEARLRDIIRGNISFRKQKPQIIVFPEGQIAKFPKYLKDIVNKLKKNKKLTKSERNRLVRWQTSSKGVQGAKWKPIGDIEYRGGIELEVSLAPGNAIRLAKRLRSTVIDGTPVRVVTAKIVKLKKTTSKLLNKAKKSKLTEPEINKLVKALRKETKLKVNKKEIRNLKENLRRRVSTKKRFPLGRKISARVISKLRKPSRSRGTRRRTTRLRTRARPTRTRPPKGRIQPRRRTSRALRRPPGSAPPVKRPPKRPPRKTPKTGRKSKKKKKFFKSKKRTVRRTQSPSPVFNVYGKSGKKFVKLNVKPLARGDALSRGTFAIDNTTSRQFKIVPAGKTKKPGILKKRERNYFNRLGFKLREVKIRKGRRFKLKNRYIEKTKGAIDTRGERQGLKIAKFLKQQKIKTRKIPKRKITRTQRKVLLKNLAKARKVKRRKK